MFPTSIEFTAEVETDHPAALREQLLKPFNAFLTDHYLQELERNENHLDLRAKPLRVFLSRGIYEMPKLRLQAIPQQKSVQLGITVNLQPVIRTALFTTIVSMLLVTAYLFVFNGVQSLIFRLVTFLWVIALIVTYTIGYISTYHKAKDLFADYCEWANSVALHLTS